MMNKPISLNPSQNLYYQDAQQFVENEFFPRSLDSAKSSLNVSEAINQHLRGSSAKKDPEYYGPQPGVVHVTELQKCLRGVALRLLGAAPDEEFSDRQLGVFQAGNLFEDFILNALGSAVVGRQREYRYRYKDVVLVGRSDFLIKDGDKLRIGENKSVHSDSFWRREREGALIAWNNQLQLQTYMWLERILTPFRCESCDRTVLTDDGVTPSCSCKSESVPMTPIQKIEPGGLFTYISKDDCTVVSCPIKFNQSIIDNCVLPALEVLNTAYSAKDAMLAPVPDALEFSVSNNRWQRNWLASYCLYHEKCAPGWSKKAAKLVTERNLEGKLK